MAGNEMEKELINSNGLFFFLLMLLPPEVSNRSISRSVGPKLVALKVQHSFVLI